MWLLPQEKEMKEYGMLPQEDCFIWKDKKTGFSQLTSLTMENLLLQPQEIILLKSGMQTLVRCCIIFQVINIGSIQAVFRQMASISSRTLRKALPEFGRQALEGFCIIFLVMYWGVIYPNFLLHQL